MMTNKDCKDFADFVEVLQKKEKENEVDKAFLEDLANNTPNIEQFKENKIKRPNSKDQTVMALYAKIKELHELNDANGKLLHKLRLELSKLKDYVRKIKRTSRCSCN